ncbi:MAG: OsmC family protein [Pseudobdellovibrio sp.]
MAVISSKRIAGYQYEIDTGTHQVISDVKAKIGGEDKGPDPHEYLEISLAACTSITLQMYAKRKNMPLESVDVTIKITEEGAVNQIERTVKLVGALSDADRTSLMMIAEKCPIHKFLSNGAKITTGSL